MVIKDFSKVKIDRSEDVAALITILLKVEDTVDRDKEHLWVIGLNTKGRIKFVDLVHLGSLDGNLASPREVFRRAVMNGVKTVIIAHNHPSGDPKPSPKDCHITKKLYKAGQVLEIELLDHVIVGEQGRYFSFGDAGKIPEK
jgi:DNA repair protein RadC